MMEKYPTLSAYDESNTETYPEEDGLYVIYIDAMMPYLAFWQSATIHEARFHSRNPIPTGQRGVTHYIKIPQVSELP